MNEADGISISDVLQITGGVVLGLVAAGIDEPVIVGILVVIASNLLLVGTLWVGLNVGVQQTTAVTHVLNGDSGSMDDLKRAVSAHLGATQVGLEKRAHLRITRTTVGQNGEMQVERKHVYQNGDDDQASHASKEMLSQQSLGSDH
jgi:mannose/fructose/N-acetylgalactosamine-specific phosphotransferase system component IID